MIIEYGILFVSAVLLYYKALFGDYNLSQEINQTPLVEKAQFKKLIYVLLDGLRFDGLVPVNKSGFYYNNMSFITDDTINKHVFLSIAGIPTATRSRVIGLMSGAPSSRIDLLKSFTNNQVKIDNLTKRCKGKTCAFFGDNMWKESFESLKYTSETICGFSKSKLEKKENDIFKKMLDCINKKKPTFIFAHYISLDSHGHTYGINHEIMQKTQLRLNSYIKKTYEAMEDDTLMVVVSDHGVTDAGAHSGSSNKELASICCFLTKKILPKYEFDRKLQIQFLKRFYEVEKCNTKDDWIQSIDKYNVIHQDDIVITTCYLLGIPVPFNSHGNLIPHIVNDQTAYKNLAEFKAAKISEKAFNINDSESLLKINYEASQILYKRSFKTHLIIGILAFLILGWLLFRVPIKLTNLIKSSHVIFVIIMVCHSYWCFASEDYLWFFALILENFTFVNFLAFFIYFSIPRNNFFTVDKIFSNFKLFYFETSSFPFISLTLFCFFFVFIFFKKSKFPFLPQIIFSFFRFIPIFKSKDLKMAFLASFFSIESLISIHFSPFDSLLLFLLLPNLDINYSASSKFIILQLIGAFCNLENVVQSIDFTAFFVFTDLYDLYSVSLSAIAYFLLPRLFLSIAISRKHFAKRQSDKFNLIFFFVLHIFVCFACSWIMNNTFIFDHSFMGRLLFVTGNTLVDFLLNLCL